MFCIKRNGGMQPEAYFFITFPKHIEGKYGMLIHLYVRERGTGIDEALAWPEAQAILDSVKLK